VFDPALLPREQTTSVGPVGWWLGWGLFRALGYAGFLLPLLLGGWGVSAFVRPKIARGWVPLLGLGALLLAAAWGAAMLRLEPVSAALAGAAIEAAFALVLFTRLRGQGGPAADASPA